MKEGADGELYLTWGSLVARRALTLFNGQRRFAWPILNGMLHAHVRQPVTSTCFKCHAHVKCTRAHTHTHALNVIHMSNVHAHTRTHARTHTHTHICTHTSTSFKCHTQVKCAHTHPRARTHPHTNKLYMSYSCQMCAHTHTHTHSHTQTHTPLVTTGTEMEEKN